MTGRALFTLPPSIDDFELAGYLRAQILDGTVRLDSRPARLGITLTEVALGIMRRVWSSPTPPMPL